MPRKMTVDEFNKHGGADYSRYADIADKALAAAHPAVRWIEDTIPTSRRLYDLYQEFKHRTPDAIPVLELSRGISRFAENGRFYTSVGIAFKDAPDILCGRLFMADDPKGGGLCIYSVMSPHVKNERYSVHSKEYHMRGSKDFKKAVTLARQFIKPKRIEEVIDEHTHVRESCLRAIQRGAYETLRDKLSLPMETLGREVRNMLLAGYKPITAEFTTAMALIETQGAELERIANYAPEHCYVWIRPDHALYKLKDSEAAVRVNDIEEFPQEIRDKLAVLQIAEVHSPITDVGVRIDDTKFWVFL